VTYQVIPRKYRPRLFEDIVGQNPIVQTIQGAIRSERIAHAFLFTGPHGVGKTSTARVLAKALNCEQGISDSPCGDCESCLRIAQGVDLDVREINGADNRGVDEIRNIIEECRLSPTSSRLRVYIIDEVHQLTDAAFNALLKTLEEPPPHVHFILATTQPSDIPSTIQSRCQRYDFRPVQIRDVVERLQSICSKEKIDSEEVVLYRLASRADGSLRDSQKLLDQLVSFQGKQLTEKSLVDWLGLTPQEELNQTVQDLIQGDVPSLLSRLDRFFQEGKDLGEYLESLIQHLRNMLLASYEGLDPSLLQIGKNEFQVLRDSAQHFDAETTLLLIQHLLELQRRMSRPGAHRVLVEITFLKMAQFRNLLPLSEAIEIISKTGLSTPSPPQSPPGSSFQSKHRQVPQSPQLSRTVQQPHTPPTAQTAVPTSTLESKTRSVPTACEHPVHSIEEIRKRWPQVLSNIAAQDPHLEALLRPAQLRSFEQQALTLTFNSKSKFTITQIRDTERILRVEEAVRVVLGENIRLRLEIEQDQLPNRSRSSQAREDPSVLQALELFQGRIVHVEEPRHGK
jgi:DNA polymerase-3 subunit gamma/tau